MTFIRYESRFQAGELLAKLVSNDNEELKKQIKDFSDRFLCFAIPNGGIPVAEGFCYALNINYDLIIVRKIKIPFNTEAGFGSITTDGSILINESLLNYINLSKEQVENSISLTKNEIKERLKLYNKTQNLEQFYKRQIFNKEIFKYHTNVYMH